MNNDNKMSDQSQQPHSLRPVIKFIIIMAVVLGLFFGLAGRLDWYAGWALMIVFFAYLLLIAIWGRRNDPELIAERTSPGEGVKNWDKIIMAVYTVLLITLLVVSILDGGRFGWTHVPLWASILGWLGCILAGLIIWRVMKENTFLSEYVRIQKERGHYVITTGPYRIVRHPMYIGIIIFLICTPLVLGSLIGFFISLPTAALFVLRTILEDRMLMEELPGYQDYARKTRYRLLPYIW